MRRFLLSVQIVLACLILTSLAVNEGTGILQGRVYDSKTNKGIPFATVTLEQNGSQKGLGETDENGNYTIKPITEGKYDVKVVYLGYQPLLIKEVSIAADKITFVNLAMNASSTTLPEVEVVTQRMIEADKTSVGKTLDKSEISHIATRKTQKYAGTVAGVFQRVNNNLNIAGSRSNATKYYVDGIEVPGYFSPDIKDEEYKQLAENSFKRASDEPLSTFSIDVDKASYSNIRRFINDGTLPPVEAVRIEEMINYFTYDYPQPTGEDPFAIFTEISSCPWNAEHRLIHIGLQGKKIPVEEIPPCNLVFLIDVSGSMMDQDKLPLLKACFRLLVDQLREEDRVSIVVYAGNAGLVLESTSGSKKEKILSAIDALQAGGSTAGSAGINLAYTIAKENFKARGNNRVILATDGDFNVGVSSDDELQKLIEEKRDEGIFLTVLGFGEGNYKDGKMELLADKGNGNYAYIDNILEGEKVFSKELAGTIYTIAKDVKLQIEFNPARVKGYRLIGYENRMLNKEDFNDDKKDAGELGAGHAVTALYEIIPVDSKEEVNNVDPLKYQNVMASFASSSGEILTVKFRYKKPGEDSSKLIIHPLIDEEQLLDQTSKNFQFAAAVAEFGLLLEDSKYKSNASYRQVISLASNSKGVDEDGYRGEFIRLARTAEKMQDSKSFSQK